MHSITSLDFPGSRSSISLTQVFGRISITSFSIRVSTNNSYLVMIEIFKSIKHSCPCVSPTAIVLKEEARNSFFHEKISLQNSCCEVTNGAKEVCSYIYKVVLSRNNCKKNFTLFESLVTLHKHFVIYQSSAYVLLFSSQVRSNLLVNI